MEKQKKSAGKMAGESRLAFEAGLALSGQGKYAEAIVEFNKALEKAPDEVYVLANLADAYFKNGQKPGSADTYQKSHRLENRTMRTGDEPGRRPWKMGKTENPRRLSRRRRRSTAARLPRISTISAPPW